MICKRGHSTVYSLVGFLVIVVQIQLSLGIQCYSGMCPSGNLGGCTKKDNCKRCEKFGVVVSGVAVEQMPFDRACAADDSKPCEALAAGGVKGGIYCCNSNLCNTGTSVYGTSVILPVILSGYGLF